MKNIITTFTLVLFGAVAPLLANAQSSNVGGGGSNNVGGNSSGGTSALQNPLAVDSISGLLLEILRVLIVIAVPIIVIFIIISGFKFVTAQGNQQKLTEAKQALLYAIIGGVLIIGALAIAEIVSNLVDAFQ